MTRVASLFLPQLAIERLRRAAPISHSGTPPEPARLAPRLPEPVDDNPGACSVPKGGGWRPGARWAQETAAHARPDQDAIDALPAHQRPPMRELGRRSEHAAPVFRTRRSDDGSAPTGAAILSPPLWGARPTISAGDGPERIHGEWWVRTGEMWAVRDYFQVETTSGERFWLFRRGDAVEAATGDLSWYIHGVFG